MNSFFARLYLDLQDRIKSEVLAIQWIEQDFGQDKFDKWRPNVAFPAVLIDFPDTNYSQESGTSQFGEVQIKLRLLCAPFSQSYEDAPIEVRRDALEFFEIENELIKSLQGWEGNYFQPLTRISASSDNRNNIGLRIRELVFTTAYEDDF
jgi:hypothetical protein